MREKDEITGLFRSRLSGTEMTVRDGFWEQLQEDAASPAAGRKRAIVLSPKYYRVAAAHPLYLCWEPLRPLSGISLRKRR